MNILKRYEKFTEELKEEFISRLNDVTNSLLEATEQLSEEESKRIFKSISREYLDFYAEFENNPERSPKKGYIFMFFDQHEDFKKQYKYNESAAESLDFFMEKNYPGIKCAGEYTLYLDEKKMEFTFRIEGKVHEEVFWLFNADISLITGKPIHEKDWNLLKKEGSYYISGNLMEVKIKV